MVHPIESKERWASEDAERHRSPGIMLGQTGATWQTQKARVRADPNVGSDELKVDVGGICETQFLANNIQGTDTHYSSNSGKGVGQCHAATLLPRSSVAGGISPT